MNENILELKEMHEIDKAILIKSLENIYNEIVSINLNKYFPRSTPSLSNYSEEAKSQLESENGLSELTNESQKLGFYDCGN